jgi:hypothetical protein
MIRAAVARASGVAQVVAAGLLAVMGVRFGVEGVLFAVRERAPTLDDKAAPPPRSAPTTTGSSAPVAPVPTGTPVKSGSAIRVPLVVTGGADRSELRVDGVKVGQTPYVGEVTCRAGEVVRLELLPPKGLPSSHERKCLPGTIKVEE